MGMIKEFKEFAMRGNVIDMAVGIVIGGAFGKIVSSLVGKVIMPAVGLITGGVDFSKKAYTVAVEGKDDVVIGYGEFLQSMLDFLIVAFAIFMVIKAMNTAKKRFEKEEEAAAPTTKKCDFCKTEIAIEATRCPNCTSELATA